jgi:polyisoprenoid-binding protein YceI
MATSVSGIAEALATGTWAVDPAHSSVEFTVVNMGLVTVRGCFREFEGALSVPAEGGAWHARGVAKAASVDTRTEPRDEQLRGPQFFDAAGHPEISFEARKFGDIDAEGHFELRGNLTIKGITRDVRFAGLLTAPAEDPWGGQRVGLKLTATVNRRDFEINYDDVAPGGALLASKRIGIELNLAAVHQGASD